MGDKFYVTHTPSLSPKTGNMADKTRDVSSRNGVAQLSRRQRKAGPGSPSSPHLAEGTIPENVRMRPFREHPGPNPSAPAAPSSTLEPVHATGTLTTRPRIPQATRFLARKAASQTAWRRGQPREDSPERGPFPRALRKHAQGPRVPLYSAHCLSVPPTASARPRP